MNLYFTTPICSAYHMLDVALSILGSQTCICLNIFRRYIHNNEVRPLISIKTRRVKMRKLQNMIDQTKMANEYISIKLYIWSAIEFHVTFSIIVQLYHILNRQKHFSINSKRYFFCHRYWL